MIYIVRGLLYGDEGKGSIVDYISQNCSDVIKEGGPQAAHHIVSKNGKLHRSEQMGSGVFNSGVRTFSSKNSFINPQSLVMENMMLQEASIYDGMRRLFIDSRCPIITPLHQMIGRLKEISRGNERHGSTGMGVGEAVKDWKEEGDNVLTMKDISNEDVLKNKMEILFSEKFKEAEMLVKNHLNNEELSEMYQYYYGTLSMRSICNSYTNFAVTYPSCIVHDGEKYFHDLLESGNNLVFEGSQGALLDPEFGFVPYVTKIKTTFETATGLIGNRVPRSDILKIGVVRAYSTRHGRGPFVTEDKMLSANIPDIHNTFNSWQGEFRIGWFDLVAVKYGISINKEVDCIAVTNLDRLSEMNNIFVCTSYEYHGDDNTCLDNFFDLEYLGNKTIITGFKSLYRTNDNLAKILFECKPIYKKFSGWKTGISNIKNVQHLPKEVIRYINFLQSKEGLNKKISIISVGETSQHKIAIDDEL